MSEYLATYTHFANLMIFCISVCVCCVLNIHLVKVTATTVLLHVVMHKGYTGANIKILFSLAHGFLRAKEMALSNIV